MQSKGRQGGKKAAKTQSVGLERQFNEMAALPEHQGLTPSTDMVAHS